MKHLTGLQAPILDLFGQPVSEGKPTGDNCPTCKQPVMGLRAITVGQFMAASVQNEPSALDAIRSMKVALKLHDAPEVELEDEDFQRLKGAWEKSGYIALIMAAGLRLLNDAEDAATVASTVAAMENGAKQTAAEPA